MDKVTAENIVKQPHEWDPVSQSYKLLTKEPNPFYPKAKYSPSGSAVAHDAEEEKAFYAGWYDHPDQVPKAVEKSADSASNEVVEALKGQIEALKAVAAQSEKDLKAATGVFDTTLSKKRRGRPPKVAEPATEA